MRILSLILIISLILPIFPSRSFAELSIAPLNAPQRAVYLQSNNSNTAFQGIMADNYLLGPGDQLEAHLIVEDNALVLDYIFTINPEGKIFFPNVAEMTLAGLTLKQARQKMIKEIKKKYDEKFSLFVMVTGQKSLNIYLTGQVDSSGLRTVTDGTRLADILKRAGVAKGGSDYTEEFVFLKRKTAEGKFVTRKINLYDIFLGNDPDKNVRLENGDIIAVPTIKSYVYVYGEIARSGTFGFVPGQTLSDYINIAGGPTVKANLSGVTVTRHENGKAKVFHVNASDIIHKGMSDKDMEILAGDVINVPGNFFYIPDFTSFLNTILLTITLYTTVAR